VALQTHWTFPVARRLLPVICICIPACLTLPEHKSPKKTCIVINSGKNSWSQDLDPDHRIVLGPNSRKICNI